LSGRALGWGTAGVGALLLLGALAWGLVHPANPGSTLLGRTAPEITVRNLDGGVTRLTALRGRPVVLNFWASWCAPCQAEQPAVNRLAQQESGRGVRFIGVSVDLDRSAAQAYVSRFAVPYDSLVDTGQAIVVDYEVAGPPTTFVIDGSGRVSAELVGELNPGTLSTDIASARSTR
jgi:cytochrome c biogenesis protein CcmG/thiol:disulfide interchange protein DsbE